MSQTVQQHGATTYASLSVLSDQLVHMAAKDRVVTIYINREQEAVVVKEPGPPQQGGRTEMAHGKHHRPGKNFQDTIANVQHTPSFIGEKCNLQID